MDGLTQCLYEYLMERRMDRLWDDTDYKACILDVELQEQQVISSLNKDQRLALYALLDRIMEQDSIEKKHLFQATLELVRDLKHLGRSAKASF